MRFVCEEKDDCDIDQVRALPHIHTPVPSSQRWCLPTKHPPQMRRRRLARVPQSKLVYRLPLPPAPLSSRTRYRAPFFRALAPATVLRRRDQLGDPDIDETWRIDRICCDLVRFGVSPRRTTTQEMYGPREPTLGYTPQQVE